MKAFDDIGYKSEVKERWGETAAYRECAEKTADYTADKYAKASDGLNAVFVEFAQCKKNGNAAGSPEAQALVEKLQNYITENFYTCTNQILAGLGQMYVCDERFKQSIDKVAQSTADYVSEAIKVYCK